MRKWIRGALLSALGVASAAGSAAGESGLQNAPARETIVQHLQQEQYRRALTALEHYLPNQPNDEAMLYNAACAAAQLNQPEAAETYLRRAVAAGFLRFSHMQRDPDLAPLRDRPVYRAIMRARQAADSIYQQRRLTSWQERLDDQRYVLMEDITPSIDALTAMRSARRKTLRYRIRLLNEHLSETLFESPLKQSVLIVHVTRADARGIFEDDHIHGTYRHASRELITLDAGRSLQHELVHALHHAHMDHLHQQHPIWIVEGLASLYEGCEPDTDEAMRFLANDRDAFMQRLVRNGETVNLSTLATRSEAEFLREPAVHYAHVRSLFRFLAERDNLTEWYESYTNLYPDDASGTLALQRVFQQPLDAIEQQWHQWIRSTHTPNESTQRHNALATADHDSTHSSQHETSESTCQSGSAKRAAVRFRQLCERHSTGGYADLIEPLRELIETKPSFAEARYKLGLAYAATGNVQAARKQYHALRELDTSLASLLANLIK